jgi:osmotically inducible protein OsmC
LLSKAGYTPSRIAASATVHLTEGPTISLIELECEAQVPGLGEEEFQEKAAAAKAGCPVSKVLAGAEIRLTARLIQ